MALTMEDMHWYAVGRYHLDGTVPMDTVLAILSVTNHEDRDV